MSTLDPELKHYAELDARMVQAVREIKVLTTMSWPVETQEAFLGAWSVGRIQMPEVSYPALDFSPCKRVLE
nr:flavohemoglobin expression-modulating QEGLA motif protein [Xanthomonadales bacterium]